MKMTNDEIRMTKEAQRLNVESVPELGRLGLRHSFVLRASCFVIAL